MTAAPSSVATPAPTVSTEPVSTSVISTPSSETSESNGPVRPFTEVLSSQMGRSVREAGAGRHSDREHSSEDKSSPENPPGALTATTETSVSIATSSTTTPKVVPPSDEGNSPDTSNTDVDSDRIATTVELDTDAAPMPSPSATESDSGKAATPGSNDSDVGSSPATTSNSETEWMQEASATPIQSTLPVRSTVSTSPAGSASKSEPILVRSVSEHQSANAPIEQLPADSEHQPSTGSRPGTEVQVPSDAGSRARVGSEVSILSTPKPQTQAASEAAATGEVSPDQLDIDGLATSISRPLANGNGTYTVTVALHPPDLGHVQADVSLDGNGLQVSINPQNAAGHEAIVKSADVLRDQLSQGGMNVNVTVRDPGHQGGGDDANSSNTADDVAGGSDIDDSNAPAEVALAAGQIHLVL